MLDSKSLPNIPEKHIPLCKSTYMRLATLDYIHDSSQTIDILSNYWALLGDDLKATRNAFVQLKNRDYPIRVDKSRTLYCIIQWKLWLDGIDKEISANFSVADRIHANKEIIYLSPERLLQLESGTSQWATAQALWGSANRIVSPPQKLQMTYDLIDNYDKERKIIYDQTILRQLIAWYNMIQGRQHGFFPLHSEDACFAMIVLEFNYENIHEQWPQIEFHESDRILEADITRREINADHSISSRDHRIIQAGVMKQILEEKPISVKYPHEVNKSFPFFFHCIMALSPRSILSEQTPALSFAI